MPGVSPDEQRAINQKLARVETSRDLAALSPREQGYWNNRRIISQALGKHGSVTRPHIYQFTLRDGDKIILTSDGIHDNLSDREIEQIARGQLNVAEDLVRHAKARSTDGNHVRHKLDDLSAVIVEVEPAEVGRAEKVPPPQPSVQLPEAKPLPLPETPLQTYDLAGGREIALSYTGKPIQVTLPGGQVLEIGDQGGLKMTGANVDFLIIDRKELKASHKQAGFKGLREGERVVLGRLTPGRFKFGERVSRQHLEIRRERGQIIIRDLNSSNGTIVNV